MKKYLEIIILILCLSSCIHEVQSSKDIVLVSYNLQTLFDDKDDGNEYEDFNISNDSWNTELYNERLKNLSSAISSYSEQVAKFRKPDIVIIQEAENPKVVNDLANTLGSYPYVLCSPDEESTLSCGIISNLAIINSKAHRIETNDSSSVPRFILEADIDTGDSILTVFAVHFKSKLGGAESTETQRRLTANFVRLLVSHKLKTSPQACIIVAGDFNENPDEYARINMTYPTAMMPCYLGKGEYLSICDNVDEASDPTEENDNFLVMYNPWNDYGGYSYRYEEQEERIDNMLFSKSLVEIDSSNIVLENFITSIPEFLIDSYGNPVKWNSKSQSGYSDHLPICAFLRKN